MPAIVFPAPGCANSSQFINPFAGFDIAPVAGGTFQNLISFSQDQNDSSWIKGTGTRATTNSLNVTTVTIDSVAWNVVDWVIEADVNSELLTTIPVVGQSLGKVVSVSPNTTYTFSFYAKLGTAIDTTFGIYDNIGQADIVSSASYTSSLNANTWSRIISTFTTGSTCTSVTLFPVWSNSTAGTTIVHAMQLELGSNATTYQPTGSVSFAGKGITLPAVNYPIVSKLKSSFKVNSVVANMAVSAIKKGVRAQGVASTVSSGTLTKQFEVVKSINLLPLPSTITKQIEVVKSANDIPSLSIFKGKIVVKPDGNLPLYTSKLFLKPIINTQVFEAPQISAFRKPFEIITSDNNQRFAANLVKYGFSIKDPNATVKISYLPKQFERVQSDGNQLSANKISKFVLPADKMSVLFTPSLSKVSSGLVARGVNAVHVAAKLTAVNRPRPTVDERVVFRTSLVNPFKIPAGRTQVLTTPDLGKATANAKAKGITNTITTSALRSGAVAKSVTSKVNAELLANINPQYYSYNNKANVGQADPAYTNAAVSPVTQVAARNGTTTQINWYNVIYRFKVGDWVRIEDQASGGGNGNSVIVQIQYDSQPPAVAGIYFQNTGNPSTSGGYFLVNTSDIAALSRTFISAWSLTKWSPSVYTQQQVFTANIYTQTFVPTNISSSTSPNINLFLATSAPINKFGVSYTSGPLFVRNISMTREVPLASTLKAGVVAKGITHKIETGKASSGLVVKSVTPKVETYKLAQLPPSRLYPTTPVDFTIQATGQDALQVYSVVDWYFEYAADSDILTVQQLSAPTITTLTFATQQYNRFDVGAEIKVYNPGAQYTLYTTVVASTYNSVSFYTPASPVPSVSGTTISVGATLLPQTTVTTKVAPLTPQENLYYFNISPGIRSNALLPFGRYAAGDLVERKSGTLSKQFEIVKPDSNVIRTGKVAKFFVDKVGTITATVRESALSPIDSSLWTYNNKVNVGQEYGKNENPPVVLPLSSSSVSGLNTILTWFVGTPAAAVGQAAFTTVGSTSWTAPAGVTSISIVAIGAGGGGSNSSTAGGGGGGGLAYSNSYTVVPGNTYSIVVGAGGPVNTAGGDSTFSNGATVVVNATGGGGAAGAAGGTAGFGTFAAPGAAYLGGTGGSFTGSGSAYGSGGGGGGGWTTSGSSGNGGWASGSSTGAAALAGAGGGGGGGGQAYSTTNVGAGAGGGGGGTGLFGLGAIGTAGTAGNQTNATRGGGGSGGTGGTVTSEGGLYGGGGGGYSGLMTGGQGAVRIMWGPGRSFPSTLVTDQTPVTYVSGLTSKYYAGNYIKITDAVGNSVVAQLIATATSSITVETAKLSTLTGSVSGWTIQSWITDFYTQSQIRTANYALPNNSSLSAGLNLFMATSAPVNKYGVTYDSGPLFTKAIALTVDDLIKSGKVNKLNVPAAEATPDATTRRSGKLFQFVTVKDALPDPVKRRSGKITKFTVDRFATPTPNENIRRVGKVSQGLKIKELVDKRKDLTQLANYDVALWNKNGQGNIGSADPSTSLNTYYILYTQVVGNFTGLYFYYPQGLPQNVFKDTDVVKVTDSTSGTSFIAQQVLQDQVNTYNAYVFVPTSYLSTFSPLTVSNNALTFGASPAYISAPSNAAFTLGASDFTIEAYIYFTAVAGTNNQYTLIQRATAGANAVTGDWTLNYVATASYPALVFLAFNQTTTTFVMGASIGGLYNSWVHMALVRSGNSLNLYLNGTLFSTAALTANIVDNSQPLNIGRNVGNTSSANFGSWWISAAANYFPGTIADLRVSKKAVYTGAFTPPNTPLELTQRAGVNVTGLLSTDVILLLGRNNATVKDDSYLNSTLTVSNVTSVTSPVPTVGGASNWTLQQWSPAVYTQMQVNFADAGNMWDLDYSKPYNAYWAAFYAPVNVRRTRVEIPIGIPANVPLASKLNTYQVSPYIVPDISVKVTSMTDVVVYNTIDWYAEYGIDSDILLGTAANTPSVTVLTFVRQSTVPFRVGSTVMLIDKSPVITTTNILTGAPVTLPQPQVNGVEYLNTVTGTPSTYTATVIAASTTSITIATPSNPALPAGSSTLYITNEPTVFAQASVGASIGNIVPQNSSLIPLINLWSATRAPINKFGIPYVSGRGYIRNMSPVGNEPASVGYGKVGLKVKSVAPKIEASKLTPFDISNNIPDVTVPIVAIGDTQQYNAVDYYLEDYINGELLTPTPTSLPQTKLYYANSYSVPSLLGSKVRITNIDYSNSRQTQTGQLDYTVPGTYTLTVPSGVSNISYVAVGAGGGGGMWSSYTGYVSGGAGGALAYKVSVPVKSGDVVTIVVGTGGYGSLSAGEASSVSVNGITTIAGGGNGGSTTAYYTPTPGFPTGDYDNPKTPIQLSAKFSNSTVSYLYVPTFTGNPFELLSQDFTIECWIYLTAIPATGAAIISHNQSGVNGLYSLSVNNVGRLSFTFNGAQNGQAINLMTSNIALAVGIWTHIVVQRTGSNIQFAFNGQIDATVYNIGVNGIYNTNGVITGPTIGYTGSNGLEAWITNLRITKGVAAYATTTFTPPYGPLSTSQTATTTGSNTVTSAQTLLLMFTNVGGATDVSVNKFSFTQPVNSPILYNQSFVPQWFMPAGAGGYPSMSAAIDLAGGGGGAGGYMSNGGNGGTGIYAATLGLIPFTNPNSGVVDGGVGGSGYSGSSVNTPTSGVAGGSPSLIGLGYATFTPIYDSIGNGQLGGGGAGVRYIPLTDRAKGGNGGVRIIWGAERKYPSTNTASLPNTGVLMAPAVSTSSYAIDATVVEVGVNYIVVDAPTSTMPASVVGGNIITGSSIYSQSLVRPVARNIPTLARDNFFFSVAAQGLQRNVVAPRSSTPAGTTLTPVTSFLNKAFEVVKSTTPVDRVSKLSSNYKAVADKAVLTVSQLQKAFEKVQSDNNVLRANKLNKFLVNSTQVHFTPSASMLRNGFSVGSVLPILKAGNLPKPFEAVVSVPVKLTVDKLKAGYQVTDIKINLKSGNLPKPFEAVTGDLFKFRVEQVKPVKFSNNQVLYTPAADMLRNGFSVTSDKLRFKVEQLVKGYEAVKGDKLRFTTEQLVKAYEAVKGESIRFITESLPKQFESAKGDQITLRSGIIRPVKFGNNQVFFTPRLSTLKGGGISVTSTANNIKLSILKDSYVATSTANNIKAGVLPKQFEAVKGEQNKFVPGIIPPVKFKNNEVFYSPLTDFMRKPFESVTSDNVKIKSEFFRTGHVVKDTNPRRLSVEILPPVKFKNNEVFYTPDSSKFKFSIVAKDLTYNIKPAMMKAEVVVKADPQKITLSNLKSGTVIRAESAKLTLDSVLPIKFKNNEVFYTPTTAKLTPFDVPTDAPDLIYPAWTYVSGKNDLQHYNAIDWYTEYSLTSELLTPDPTTSDTITLYYAPSKLSGYQYIKAGDLIALITDTNMPLPLSVRAVVQSATEDSVTILAADIWPMLPSQINYITIATNSVFPQNKVVVDNRAPINPRENLYYAVMWANKYGTELLTQSLKTADVWREQKLLTEQLAKAYTKVKDPTFKNSTGFGNKKPVEFAADSTIIRAELLKASIGTAAAYRAKIELGHLLKAFEKVNSDTIRISSGLIPPVKFKNNEIFESPFAGKLAKTLDNVKGDKVVVSPAFLKAGFVVKDLTNNIKTGIIKGGISIKAVIGEDKLRAISFIPPVKFYNNQVFINPALGELPKPFESIKGDRVRLTISSVVASVPIKAVKGEEALRTISFIPPVKFKNNQMFYSLSTDMLSAGHKARGVFGEDKLRTISFIPPVKFKNNQMFATPKLDTLRQGFKVTGDKLRFNLENLKDSYKAIDALAVIKVGLLPKQFEAVKGEKNRLLSGVIPPVTFKNNEVFYVPKITASAGLGYSLKDLKNNIKTDYLQKPFEKIIADKSKLVQGVIPPVKFRNNEVFYVPKVIASAGLGYSLTDLKNNLKTDYLRQGFSVKEVKLTFKTEHLTKQLHTLKDLPNNIKIAHLPKSLSILKSLPDPVHVYRMETFDNQGAFDGPALVITGASNMYHDVVTYYIYEDDVLNVVTFNDTVTQTIYFENPDVYNSNYFHPGDYVTLTDLATGETHTTQVLASTGTSITIITIPNFPSTTLMGTVQNASATVFPQSYYAFHPLPRNPVTPRDNLAYFELIPAIRRDRAQHYQEVLLPIIEKGAIKPNGYVSRGLKAKEPRNMLTLSRGTLRSTRKYKEAVSELLRSVAKIDRVKTDKRNSGIFEIDTSVGHIDLRELLKAAVVPNELKVDVLVKTPRSTENPYEVFFIPPAGGLARFKTGDFKAGSVGVVDVTFVKPPPIQFWS